MSITSVPRQVDGPPMPTLPETFAKDAGRVLRMPGPDARAEPTPPAAGQGWRAALVSHAAALDAVLEAAAAHTGIALSPAAREAIVWRTLGAMDDRVHAVAVFRAKAAFTETVARAPRPLTVSLADDAVSAAVAAFEARLALGRIR